jgi:branched-chain amino acid transport system substrate-binding protein
MKGGFVMPDRNRKIGSLISMLAISLFVIFSFSWAAVYAQEPIKVCVIATLTGPVGPIGQSELAGAKVAEMHINEDGGILGRKVVVIDRDDAASPATAVKVVREAAMNENVKIFTGLVSSACGLAIAPILEQLDSLVLVAAAATHKLTGENCNPYVVRICTNAPAAVRSSAKVVVDNYPNVTRWAGINPDYEYGHDCFEGFKKSLKNLNPKVTFVEEQWPKFMATNFEPQILKLMQAKPEGIYSSLYSGDFVTFVKQAKKYQFFDNLKIFLDHSVETDVAKPLGPEMPEIWGGSHYYYAAYDNPLNKRFLEGHNKLYGTLPVYASSETYTAMFAVKQAAEKAKSLDTKTLIKNLRGLTLETISGKRVIQAWNHQTMRFLTFLHFKPTKESPGWKVDEVKLVWSEPFEPKPNEPEGACKMKW